jgi:hypothetical protein
MSGRRIFRLTFFENTGNERDIDSLFSIKWNISKGLYEQNSTMSVTQATVLKLAQLFGD